MSKLMTVVEFLSICSGLVIMAFMIIKAKMSQGINYVSETKPVSYLMDKSAEVQSKCVADAEKYLLQQKNKRALKAVTVNMPAE